MMKDRSGLSLLEVVISVTILVIVFFTACELFVSGFSYYRTSQYATEMMKMAQDRMELEMRDRGPGGPGRVPAWVRFQDDRYVYMIDVDYYNMTGSSGFNPAPTPHTPYKDNPNYDLYTVTLTAKGPLNPDGTDGALTRTLMLRSLIAPDKTFYPGYSGQDENIRTGASSLWSRP